MKTIKNIFALLLIFIGFNSCMDEYTEVFTANSPVYMSFDDLRTAVKSSAATDLKNPGKIYFKDGFIFVNEEMKGIHIIDNRNPNSPQNLKFIEIPGNVDIAVKNNILYADSYVDLVAIDISDMANPREINRVKDVFPYMTPPPKNEDYRLATVDKEKGVVIDWEIKKVRQEIEYHYYPSYLRFGYAESDMWSNAGGQAKGQTGNSFGIGGSMARFGLYDDYLYAVDNATLYMFDVKSPDKPKDIGKQNIGWDIETMFIYDRHMFLGTRSGMLVFSLKVPANINYVGKFLHVTSCDPVVISDGYAYITLRGGNVCGSNVNRLDVLKLSDDYKNNQLLASYPLTGPYGLGIEDQTLFVCDGNDGLKIYDATDKLNIDDHMIAKFTNINTFDVIPFDGFLFMIGDDGFYQYDYSDLQNIKQISFIPVKRDK
jgi:hypothetical protein